jgi:hypothetical protein
MMFRLVTATLLALLAPAANGAQEIVRCKAAGGGVTYQQTPCPDRWEETRTGIASEYPAPNVVERDRLFEREAALLRRLEARRDRELKESQMREARAEREAERERLAALIAAQAAQPQYIIAFPGMGARNWAPVHRRIAPPGATRNGPIYR